MTPAQPGAEPDGVDRRQIFWMRWAVRGVLILGVAASLAANMLHAEPNPYARVIAAWPPVALFVTIEVISRVPVDRAILATVRVAATVAIGGIAAWVSYQHMVAVVARYGERGAAPYLLPFSVDGLVVIASISLFQLAARLRGLPPDPIIAVRVAGAEPVPDRDGHPLSPSDSVPAEDPRPATTGARQLTAAQVLAKVSELRQTKPPVAVEDIARQVGRSVRQVQRIIERADQLSHRPKPTVNGAQLPDLASHRGAQQ